MSNAAKEQLSKLVRSVLQDGVISDDERAEMRDFYANAQLTVAEVKEVFSSYISALGKDALADGILTKDEAATLKSAVEQLRIPPQLLPPLVSDIVTGKKQPDE